MKYRCIPCDSEFEAEEGAKLRCPKCLGIHDLERVSDKKNINQNDKKQWIAPLVILAVLAVLIIIYFSLQKEKTLEIKPEAEVKNLSEILGESGAPKSEIKSPFAASGKIGEFASKAIGGKSGIQAMQALFEAIADLRSQGVWKPCPQREPRPEEPLDATSMFERLGQKGLDPYEALSYELACLLLASARSQNLDAKMVEIYSFKGEKKPADPGGKLGRFGVVLAETEKEKPNSLFDPYSERSMENAEADFKVLTDVEAAAPYFGLRSLALLVNHDNSAALKQNEIAIKLAPENPYFRVGRGLIFASSAAPGEALAEFEKAAKQRQDAVFKTNLAEILLLVDPTGKRAEAEIHAALTSMPDFARAHALLAMIYLVQRQTEQAEQELALAERLDPDSPVTAMFWAQLLASQTKPEEAIAKAKEAVRLSEDSVSSLLGLAGIYRATARFDEMRATLDKVLGREDSAGMRQQIKDLFGYESGKNESGDEPAAEGAEPDALRLRLGREGPSFGGDLDLGRGLDDGLKLDRGLGGGLGENKKPGLGGEHLKLNLDLKKN
jgi:tetratricopeptide (TPR) repeat protein